MLSQNEIILYIILKYYIFLNFIQHKLKLVIRIFYNNIFTYLVTIVNMDYTIIISLHKY